MTAEEFVTTKQAPRPDDLMSVKAYYEMHADEDDRPLVMKMRLGLMPEDKPEVKEEE